MLHSHFLRPVPFPHVTEVVVISLYHTIGGEFICRCIRMLPFGACLSDLTRCSRSVVRDFKPRATDRLPKLKWVSAGQFGPVA